MKNSNIHLVPINVIDIVDKLYSATNENEVNNYTHRLEVIRDYCNESLQKISNRTEARNVKNFKR